ncbi:diguanylate cyclase domain-containing protein [Pseudomonadota bacterium]
MEDLHKLDKPELVRLLSESQKALALNEEGEKRQLHDLQVHQIELELQNHELRESQQALELARDSYADLYDFAPVGYLTLDSHGVISKTNLTAAALLGIARGELSGKPFATYVAKASKSRFYHHLKSSCAENGDNVVTEIELRPRVGSPRQIQLESIPQVSENGERVSRTVMVDITARKQAEEHYRLANTVLENTPEGVMVTDLDLRIIMVNPAFTKTTGYSRKEAIGQTPRLLQSGRHDKAFYNVMWEQLQNRGKWAGEIWNRNKNGEIYPEWLIISEIRDADGNVTHYAGTFNDVASQAHIRERLHKLAYYDPVTALANRELLQDKFQTLLSLSKRHNKLLALLFLDLDQFKQVNDTLGHLIGDELLKETAGRLLGCVRETDIVARLGGDEFIVLLTDLPHQEDIEVVAEKIVNAFEVPFILEGKELYVTTSVGISICPNDGVDFTTLVRNADAAMYKVKKAGRNNFQFFKASLTEIATERVLLASHLHRAIEKGQLQLHYQPQISISTGALVGIEALARWNHPEFGMVPPTKFIAVAEETGYIPMALS